MNAVFDLHLELHSVLLFLYINAVYDFGLK